MKSTNACVLVVSARVPGQTDVQVVEQPLASHIDFAADRFFGGRAVIANRAPQLPRRDQFLDCRRGSQAPRPEQIVTAPVPGRAWLEDFLPGKRLLREARQRIIFAQDSDDRLPLSVSGDEGGGHARHAALHAEPLRLGVVSQELRRALLPQRRFGEARDRRSRRLLLLLVLAEQRRRNQRGHDPTA